MLLDTYFQPGSSLEEFSDFVKGTIIWTRNLGCHFTEPDLELAQEPGTLLNLALLQNLHFHGEHLQV